MNKKVSTPLLISLQILFIAINFCLLFIDDSEDFYLLYAIYYLLNIVFLSLFLLASIIKISPKKYFYYSFPILIGIAFLISLYSITMYISLEIKDPINQFFYMYWLIVSCIITLIIPFLFKSPYRGIAFSISVSTVQIIAFLSTLGNLILTSADPLFIAPALMVLFISFIIVKGIVETIQEKHPLVES